MHACMHACIHTYMHTYIHKPVLLAISLHWRIGLIVDILLKKKAMWPYYPHRHQASFYLR